MKDHNGNEIAKGERVAHPFTRNGMNRVFMSAYMINAWLKMQGENE